MPFALSLSKGLPAGGDAGCKRRLRQAQPERNMAPRRSHLGGQPTL